MENFDVETKEHGTLSWLKLFFKYNNVLDITMKSVSCQTTSVTETHLATTQTDTNAKTMEILVNAEKELNIIRLSEECLKNDPKCLKYYTSITFVFTADGY